MGWLWLRCHGNTSVLLSERERIALKGTYLGVCVKCSLFLLAMTTIQQIEGSCEHGDEPSGSLKLLGIS
jgi:hypothetical protein